MLPPPVSPPRPAPVRSPRRARPSAARASVLVVLSLVHALAACWAAWWIVGPQDGVPVSAAPDYLFEPPTWGPLADHGWYAVAVALAAVTGLVLTTAALAWCDRWVGLGAVGCVVAAAVIVGGGARVQTAGVIGANIGGGMVIMFGWPLAALLLVLALWGLVRGPR